MKKSSNKKILIVAGSMVILSLFILITTPRAVSQEGDQLASIIFYGKIPGFDLKSNSKLPAQKPVEVVEEKTEISGKYIINVKIEDDFLKNIEKTKQTILIDKKEYEFTTENINAEIKSGIYEVKGLLNKKTNKVVLNSAKIADESIRKMEPPKDPKDEIPGKSVAVFLVDYMDTATQPFYPNTVNEIMFGDGKFAKYFKEASYGRQSITGDVFGWFTIPQNIGKGSCRQANLSDDPPENPSDPEEPPIPSPLGEFISGSPINLDDYGNIVIITLCNGYIRDGSSNTTTTPYVINGVTYNKVVTWANVGNVNWNHASNQMLESINGEHMMNNIEHLLVHEFGHALGLNHAHGIRCEGTIPDANCQIDVNIWNYFDTMAYDTIGLHFNAWAKAKLGWFLNAELGTITQSGIYSISNLESQPNTLSSAAPKAYKIKPSSNSNKTPIWIEFRKAVGFDKGIATPALGGIYGGGGEVPPHDISDNQDGIMIYKEGFVGNLGNQISAANARLMYLRNSPNLGTSANPYQVSLNPGQTFSDPRYGLTITTLPSVNSNSRKFQVQMNPDLGCTRVEPAINTGFGNVPTTANRGASIYLSIRLVNMDYLACPNSDFVPTFNSDPLPGSPPLPPQINAENINENSLLSFLSNLAPDDERIFTLRVFVGQFTPVGQYDFPVTVENTSSELSQTLYFPISVI